MGIKIPDNLMNRPMSPGGISDGSENVTRQFGNREEQSSNEPMAPSGWGGVANPAAGAAELASARAVETVASSVEDAVKYIDNVKTADEDSRQKSMMLRIATKSDALRKVMRADPELAARSVDEQQSAYTIQRDQMIDDEVQKEGFSQPKVQKFVSDNVNQYKSQDAMDYNDKVLVPQMVEARKQRDASDIGDIVSAAQLEQSPESALKAKSLINDRFTSPEAYATYGAVQANMLHQKALTILQTGVTTSFIKGADEVFAGLPDKLGMTGIIGKDALNDGPIKAAIDDQVGKLAATLKQTGANDGQILIATDNFRHQATINATAAIMTHNEAFKAATKEKLEADIGTVTSFGDSLFIAASSGKATATMVTTATNSTLRSLGIDPVEWAKGTIDDPAQVKLGHAVLTQVARVEAEQHKVERENARDSVEREKLRLQQVQSIMPSTQPGADLSFKDFRKTSGIGSKNVIDFTPDDWTKFNAYTARTSPTHLASEVNQGITWGINSADPAAQKSAVTAFVNLEKTMPDLAAKVDVRTREIVQRLKDGQDIKSAKQAVDAAVLRTPDEKAAIQQVAAKTIEQWQRGSTHPIAMALGVPAVQPAVIALANREYTDAIARGESPDVAKATMIAKVRSTTAPTTLMSGDGSTVMAVNAPEARFQVGKQPTPGMIGKLFGARENPAYVPPAALTEDIKKTLSDTGNDPESKYFLGQPVERKGVPYYPIHLINRDGADSGPAMDKNGSPILWTFDPNNNPVMDKQRTKIKAYDDAAAATAQQKLVDAEYQTLQAESRRRGDPRPKDLDGVRKQAAAKREEAFHNVTGQ